MISRLFFVVLPVAALACGIGGTTNVETACGGFGGTTTIASGGSGGAGTGGAPEPLPACDGSGSGYGVEMAIFGPDGNLVNTRVSAAVTVASIDGCATVTCQSPGYPHPSISTAANRIVLSGSGTQRWNLYLRNSKMPSDLIKVGDGFDLTVDGERQTVILSHGSDLVAFASSQSPLPGGPTVPDLSAFQIDVAQGETTCVSSGGCSSTFQQAALVTIGGQTVSVKSGQTAKIGWLLFTSDAFLYEQNTGGICDGPSALRMAGFRLPATCR